MTYYVIGIFLFPIIVLGKQSNLNSETENAKSGEAKITLVSYDPEIKKNEELSLLQRTTSLSEEPGNLTVQNDHLVITFKSNKTLFEEANLVWVEKQSESSNSVSVKICDSNHIAKAIEKLKGSYIVAIPEDRLKENFKSIINNRCISNQGVILRPVGKTEWLKLNDLFPEDVTESNYRLILKNKKETSHQQSSSSNSNLIEQKVDRKISEATQPLEKRVRKLEKLVERLSELRRNSKKDNNNQDKDLEPNGIIYESIDKEVEGPGDK